MKMKVTWSEYFKALLVILPSFNYFGFGKWKLICLMSSSIVALFVHICGIHFVLLYSKSFEENLIFLAVMPWTFSWQKNFCFCHLQYKFKCFRNWMITSAKYMFLAIEAGGHVWLVSNLKSEKMELMSVCCLNKI